MLLLTSLFLPILTILHGILASPVSASFTGTSGLTHKHRNHIRQTQSFDPSAIRRTSAQIQAFLAAHNIVRVRHHAQPLKWSVPLAENAEKWADQCIFKHTNGVLSENPYGEIIVAGTGDFSIQAAVKTFVQDAIEWDPRNPKYTHFTQVIWQSTTELGCAISKCPDLLGKNSGTATLYVCLYNPPGNVIGKLNENVNP